MADLRISDLQSDPSVSDTRLLEVSTGAGGSSYSLTIGALKAWFASTFASLSGAVFTGAVQAPKPTVDDSSSNVATTSWFSGQLANSTPAMAGTAAAGTSSRAARIDHIHPVDTSRVAKAGDQMTGALDLAASVTVTAAATTPIGNAASNFVLISGGATITAFDNVNQSVYRFVRFDTAGVVLTYNASSLILPTSANITTQANDHAIFRSLGSGNWRCLSYQRADGTALTALTRAQVVAGAFGDPLNSF